MTTGVYFQRQLFLEWRKFNCDRRSDAQRQTCIALEIWLGNVAQRGLFNSVNYSSSGENFSKNRH